MKVLKWFKRKQIGADALAEFLQAEHKLLQEGWINWCQQPPRALDAVYVRRTLDETITVVSPKELHPTFNVANLWWLPHRHEIEIYNPKMLN